MPAMRPTRHRVLGLGFALTIALGTAFAFTAGPASAAAPVLTVRQTTADGPQFNDTNIVVHVHNAGTADATNLALVLLLKGGPTTNYVNTGGCTVLSPPRGWSAMLSCVQPTLAAGKTWAPTFTVFDGFTSRVKQIATVGAAGQPGPTAQSTLHTYAGQAADLELTQTPTAGSVSGHVTITTSIRNRGPWTANTVTYTADIDSPTFASATVQGDTPGTACSFTSPPEGFQAAITCTVPGLAPRKTSTLTFDLAGGRGRPVAVSGSTTTTIFDPNTANNEVNTQTTYAS